ncbi:META domain-containing protein [Rubrobacter tropicus]|uniref:META domain-containing protein n=1 Tax=Rubrobacter tropicus TaxID=2653851 RepID=UPI00140B64D4|nr:META domain-containing protein [Rubrobacter tropicus]
MRRRKVFTTLVLTALIAAVVACGSKEENASEPAPKNQTVSPGDFVDYEGPRSPGDSEWLLRSLNGDGAAEGSDITLNHLGYDGKFELNVEGGCIGFFLMHKLEGRRIRAVEPGLQVGRLDCGKPEQVKRQAESILDIMRDLARVRATEDRFELTSASGEVAVFVPRPRAGGPGARWDRVVSDLLAGQETAPETPPDAGDR